MQSAFAAPAVLRPAHHAHQRAVLSTRGQLFQLRTWPQGRVRHTAQQQQPAMDWVERAADVVGMSSFITPTRYPKLSRVYVYLVYQSLS
jgi:hypothetical protein